MRDVLAPDFYDYPWMPLAAAEPDGRFVELRWADGAELRVFDLWLRENFVGEGAINPDTREGTVDPAQLTDDITLTDVGVDPDGALTVSFAPEQITARYHPGWLHHIAAGRQRATSWLPEPEVWTTAELSAPPTHDGSNVLEDDQVLRAWVNDLLRYGIARLENLPTDPDFGVTVCRRIGAVRDTNFGSIWDVRATVDLDGDPTKNSNANTRQRLAPHTDLPTRETPPGFQFLHCVVNSTDGGYSTMADGAAVVDHIAENHPDDYEALTTLKWVFFNRGRGLDHRWSAPIIDLGVSGSPLTQASTAKGAASMPTICASRLPVSICCSKRPRTSAVPIENVIGSPQNTRPCSSSSGRASRLPACGSAWNTATSASFQNGRASRPSAIRDASA